MKHDPEFVDARRAEVLAYYREHNEPIKIRNPLLTWQTRFVSPSSVRYDKAVHAAAKKVGYGSQSPLRLVKRERLLAIYRKTGRTVLAGHPFYWLQKSFCSPTSAGFDEEVRVAAVAAGYREHARTRQVHKKSYSKKDVEKRDRAVLAYYAKHGTRIPSDHLLYEAQHTRVYGKRHNPDIRSIFYSLPGLKRPTHGKSFYLCSKKILNYYVKHSNRIPVGHALYSRQNYRVRVGSTQFDPEVKARYDELPSVYQVRSDNLNRQLLRYYDTHQARVPRGHRLFTAQARRCAKSNPAFDPVIKARRDSFYGRNAELTQQKVINYMMTHESLVPLGHALYHSFILRCKEGHRLFSPEVKALRDKFLPEDRKKLEEEKRRFAALRSPEATAARRASGAFHAARVAQILASMGGAKTR